MANILLVDDSAFQHRSLHRLLRDQDHMLLDASNAHEALVMMDKQPLDCIFLDIIMPGLTGLELLKLLRDKQYAVPVIMITADIQDTTRRQCMDLGAFAVLNKPLQADDLQRTLRAALEHKGTQPA